MLENGVALKPLTAAIAGGCAIILSGLVTIFWEGFSFSGLFELLFEGIVAVLGALAFEKSLGLV